MYDSSDDEEDWRIYRLKVISLITDKVYLGDKHVANDFNLLKEYNIKRIISLGGFDEHPEYEIHDEIEYLFIYVDDNDSEPIYKHFNDCINFINQSNENILIHCYAGVSRSATITIAYIMFQNKLSFSDAFCIVKNKRKFICPNVGFQEQLISFQNYV